MTGPGTDIRLYCAVSDLKSISTTRIDGWKRHFTREPPASPYDDIKRKNSLLQELAERLRQSEMQYKQVTNSLPLLIFSSLPGGQLLYANDGFLGYFNDNLVGINQAGWLTLFHPDDRQAVHIAWADSVATGLPFRGEWRIRNGASGDYSWHLTSATPLRAADQQIIHWNGFFADIHAQKVVDQTLRENEALRQNTNTLETSRQQLEGDIGELNRSNIELSQFAYVASHDLQEPLRKIQSFSTMLTEQYAPALDANAQDIIRRMQTATARMQELIRGLLAYSRLNTEKPIFKKVSLATLIADVQSDLDTAIRERDAQIQVAELPVIRGNALQLRQLFQNLLSNAIKFTPAEHKPVIIIAASPLSASERAILLPDRSGSYLQISVQDNGIGFDEKYIDRIFNLFQRLHGRNEYAGTGIGLAVCRKVVDNHGGHLTARSKPGQGTTFLVYLPVE